MKYKLIFCIVFVLFFKKNACNLGDEEKEKEKEKLLKLKKKSGQNFHPLEILFLYLELDNEIQKRNEEKIKKMKKQLSDISVILSNMLFTKLSRNSLNITEVVLKRFDISINDNSRALLREIKDKDFVFIVDFKEKNNNRLVKYYLNLIKDRSDKGGIKHINKLEIDLNYQITKEKIIDHFKIEMIRTIFKVIGFRYETLKSRKIRNKFNVIPYYLIKDKKSFYSYKKYLDFTNSTYKEIGLGQNEVHFADFWSDNIGLHDIMSKNLHPDSTISELTLNLFNDFPIYSVNKCNIFKYNGGFGRGFSCLRPHQKCLDKGKYDEKYFIEYNIYKDSKIKCYLNSRENIIRKTCGIINGDLYNDPEKLNFSPIYKPIIFKEKINHIPIPELNYYKSQKIKLLKRPKSCANYYPRNIYFSVPTDLLKKAGNNKNEKKIEYDEIEINEENRKFFVTFQTNEDNYQRESVLKVIQNSNLIRSFHQMNSHNLIIKCIDDSKLSEVGTIPKFQKFYCFINFDILAYKYKTFLNYYSLHKYFPNDYNYMPETYLYPENKTIINELFSNYKIDKENLWLIKPQTGSLGKGIYIFQNLQNTPEKYLITRYINHPHLINNKKYDFRVYALLTGVTPLKIYLYKEGMVRFASREYSLEVDNLLDSFRHLTNVDINTQNSEYKYASQTDTEEGTKWSLKAYRRYCKRNNIDYHNIREQMADIIIKSFISIQDKYLFQIKETKADYQSFFQVYGFDFILSEKMKVYLLEINDRPSFFMGDINDYKLKPQLVADTLNIVGIIPFSHDYKDNFQPYDNFKMNKEYPIPKSQTEKVEQRVEETLCEFGRPRGGYELIFPLPKNIKKYRKFFKYDFPTNSILWKKIKNNSLNLFD